MLKTLHLGRLGQRAFSWGVPAVALLMLILMLVPMVVERATKERERAALKVANEKLYSGLQ